MAKSKFTRWFSIDKDGQPIRKGWYEVLYDSDKARNADGATLYWDGIFWIHDCDDRHSRCAFGNYRTRGERWRGLSQEPIKVTE